MKNALISMTGVDKKINDKMVLDNINLDIEEAKIYGFIEHHGASKTMLFKALAGLIYINSGKINRAKGVKTGAIIETPGFLSEYTGFTNLKLLAGIRGEICDQDIKSSMARVGLDYADPKKVKAYSLGMKQKLAIAQAVMEAPNLLILDEPTYGLDRDSIKDIRKLILEEKRKGNSILIASHNTEDIDILCDYVYTLENGKLAIAVKESSSRSL